jgi:hypothetical protein
MWKQFNKNAKNMIKKHREVFRTEEELKL